MFALASSGDFTATVGGSIHSLMEESGNQSLLKLWRQQVTRITVINRFSRKFRAKRLQCGLAPGLTAVSPQLISKVKELLDTSEGSKTRNLSKEALNSGALFSPNAPVQDAPEQKYKLRTLEKKNGEGFFFKMGDVFKDHRTLSSIQILLTLLSFQVLKEADLLDEAIALVIVTVIALDSRQEGTTATYNPVGRTVSLIGLLVLLCFSIGVNAQNDSEDGQLEFPNEPVDLPYNVQLAAWTFVAGIFMVAIINFAGRINRRPLVAATAAAPLAVRPPAADLLALSPAAAAPPAVLVPAMLIGAAAPPAVPAPAMPIGAAAPPAVPAPAMPIGAAAPPAVPAPAMPMGAAAPPAVAAPAMPMGAAAPPAVPAPAMPMGFINVMDVLDDNPAAARKSNLDFYISPSL